MKISLIISTYNWPQALNLCLNSVRLQTRMPDEVIIADDGSREETRDMIAEQAKTFPCPLHHAWIPDEGFRLSKSRNNAIRNYCSGDYVIFIDQDIILDRHFTADHERIAEEGYFVCGGRAKLEKAITDRLTTGENIHLGFFTQGVSRKLNTVHAPWLHGLTRNMYSSRPLYGRGANMAMWAKDLKAVNGFDEDIMGYGGEDVDLFNRLLNSGVKKKYAQFCAIEYHLWHKRGQLTEAKAVKNFAIERKTSCVHGLTLRKETDE